MRHFLLLVTAATLLSACGQKTETFEQLVQAGEEAFGQADYNLARQYLRRALDLNASDKNTLYLLGVSCERDYIYDSALIYYKKADLLYPNDREINRRIYEVALSADHPRNTLDAIKTLIRTGDSPEQYYLDMAEAHVKLGNQYAAYLHYRLLANSQPDNPEFLLKLSHAAALTDSLETAVEVLDSAIERYGPRPEYLTSKAVFLATMNRYDDAEVVYRNLVGIDSTQFAHRLGLANVLSSQDNRAKKQEAYEIYKQIGPQPNGEFRIDSLIAALEVELGLDK